MCALLALIVLLLFSFGQRVDRLEVKDVLRVDENRGRKLIEFQLRLDVTVHTLIKTRKSPVELLPMARTIDTQFAVAEASRYIEPQPILKRLYLFILSNRTQCRGESSLVPNTKHPPRLCKDRPLHQKHKANRAF